MSVDHSRHPRPPAWRVALQILWVGVVLAFVAVGLLLARWLVKRELLSEPWWSTSFGKVLLVIATLAVGLLLARLPLSQHEFESSRPFARETGNSCTTRAGSGSCMTSSGARRS